jgi:cytochrome P450
VTHAAEPTPPVDPRTAPERPGERAPSGSRRTLPLASVKDSLRVFGTVVVPLLSRGVIVRRPAMVRLAESTNADAKAVALLQDLRRRYGRGPLRLRLPGRRMVVILSPEHVHRVLGESPDPFTPATKEKRAALSHFEPHGVLISSVEDRAHRRPFNEEALDTPHAVHRGADAMMDKINEEVDDLLARVGPRGVLTWDDYSRMWMRIVRRVTLGDGAADDEQLTEDLVRLRATANWAFMHPQRRKLRERFLEQVGGHLARAEPGSLAGWAARAPRTPDTHPEHQVPQWLFAFDAANWASYRALGLLASHPQQRALALEEISGRDLRTPQDMPFVRAAVLESLRLWPTTPAVLRESTRRTRWEDGPMPEETNILIYAPLFHRDEENLEAAHRFEPDHWASERTERDWPFIPFSDGPVVCPGRNVVLHTTSSVLARLLAEREITLEGDRLDPSRPLPGTLDMFTMRFQVEPRAAA